jgi:hypothetical protein
VTYTPPPSTSPTVDMCQFHNTMKWPEEAAQGDKRAQRAGTLTARPVPPARAAGRAPGTPSRRSCSPDLGWAGPCGWSPFVAKKLLPRTWRSVGFRWHSASAGYHVAHAVPV